MASFWLSALLAGASVVSAVPTVVTLPSSSVPSSVPSSSIPPAPAPSCVRDELLSLLKGNKRESYPFCRDFLSAHDVSVSTVTPSASTYVTTEITTVTNVVPTTTLDVSTLVETSYSTTVVSTATITAPASTVAPVFRRGAALASGLTGYDDAAISSACNCLSPPRCRARKSTTTLEPSVFVSVATSTEVVSSTAVVTSFSTETSATTVVASVTTTTAVEPPAPTSSVFRIAIMINGVKHYFNSMEFGGGQTWEVVWPEEGGSSAATFTLDSNGHLSMPSVSSDGAVWPAMGPGWFEGGGIDGRWFIFDTLNNFNNVGWVLYKVEVDTSDNNKLRVWTPDDDEELTFQLCTHSSSKKALGVAKNNPSCDNVIVNAEFLF
ncbi:hypothetical protein OQA88_2284 [Cercophora sp. LCS_1]